MGFITDLAHSLWSVLFIGLWLVLGAFHVSSLWTGRIMGITAGPRVIWRAQRPAKFWLSWFLLAWPFVIFPLMIAVGLIIQISENS